MTAPRPPRVGILLFDGVEELDAVGPWEVLAQWAKHGALGELDAADGVRWGIEHAVPAPA